MVHLVLQAAATAHLANAGFVTAPTLAASLCSRFAGISGHTERSGSECRRQQPSVMDTQQWKVYHGMLRAMTDALRQRTTNMQRMEDASAAAASKEANPALPEGSNQGAAAGAGGVIPPLSLASGQADIEAAIFSAAWADCVEANPEVEHNEK